MKSYTSAKENVLKKTVLFFFILNFITKAGLGSPDKPEQIVIALEPEAAALSCLEKNLDAFQSEKGTGSVYGLLGQANTHYMVVDIGGKFTTYVIHLPVRKYACVLSQFITIPLGNTRRKL